VANKSNKQSSSSRQREELKSDLIRSAEELMKEPSEKFSLKKVTENADTSTQMIYTIFGGKRELLAAVYEKQAVELAERLSSVEDDDPVRCYWLLVEIYRTFYLENQELLDSLYNLSKTDEEADSVIRRTQGFDLFKEQLEQCQEKGLLDDDVDLNDLTVSLWASADGILRLETLGFFETEEKAHQRYLETFQSILQGNSPDPDQFTLPEDLTLPSN
jgi:AcrR family transcriptional regulator